MAIRTGIPEGKVFRMAVGGDRGNASSSKDAMKKFLSMRAPQRSGLTRMGVSKAMVKRIINGK